jgi:hypothetical protein
MEVEKAKSQRTRERDGKNSMQGKKTRTPKEQGVVAPKWDMM